MAGVTGGIEIHLSGITNNTFEDDSTSQFVPLESGVLSFLRIDLGDGNDSVFISGVTADALSIDGGAGENSVIIRNSDINISSVINVETEG